MKKNIHMNKINIWIYVLIGALLFLFSPLIFAQEAQTIGTIAQRIKTQIPGVLDVMSALSYIVGIVLGIQSILKFKENHESKGKTPLSTPIVFLVSSAILLALPTALTTGTEILGIEQTTSPGFTH